jgi:hypothetical protein
MAPLLKMTTSTTSTFSKMIAEAFADGEKHCTIPKTMCGFASYVMFDLFGS